MKTASIRDLRNSFPRIAAWVEEGEPVEITRGGKPFARLVPLAPAERKKFKMPDIKARLRETFGERTLDSNDLAKGLAESRQER